MSLLQEVAPNISEDSGAPSEDDVDANGPPAAVCEYGVCMVDATTATFSLGQFADDPARSRLRTLLAQQLPVEIVMEKVGPEKICTCAQMFRQCLGEHIAVHGVCCQKVSVADNADVCVERHLIRVLSPFEPARVVGQRLENHERNISSRLSGVTLFVGRVRSSPIFGNTPFSGGSKRNSSPPRTTGSVEQLHGRTCDAGGLSQTLRPNIFSVF